MEFSVFDEFLGIVVPLVVYWAYSGIYLMFGSLENYRLHSKKDEDDKNSVSKKTVVKGVLLQQAVQAIVAIFLFTVSCSLCSETLEREVLTVHKGENFPQRIVTCEFCEFSLPAVDLLEDQELCGNRTELCNLCSRYIRLRERISHESRCNGVPNILVESSSIEGVLILFLQNEVKGSTLTYLKTKIMRS